MDTRIDSDHAVVKNLTTVERTSEREVVATRTFNAPARIVFEAWTTPELLKRWWAPHSYGMTLVACEIDLRTGGGYRFVFSHPTSAQPVAFFGRYIDVTPPSRLVWTNEEGGEDGQITTVTFEDRGDQTLVVVHDLYPSKAALEASGFTDGLIEPFEQLDELLLTPEASQRR